VIDLLLEHMGKDAPLLRALLAHEQAVLGSARQGEVRLVGP
jgi:hypothetical protein